MPDIEKIIDGLNIPKQILEKSEQLLKTLFGPSFEEFSGIIADQVKLRRFKNQIRIFSKAQAELKENNIDPKKISLKVLAPMIEYSSYEEEENLQDMWAKLVAYTLSGNQDTVFQQNCISILNKLSNDEAQLMERLYIILKRKRRERYNNDIKTYERLLKQYPHDQFYNHKPKSPDEYSLSSFTFNIDAIWKDLSLKKGDFYFNISNLVNLGLLKWETNVSAEGNKSDTDPEDKTVEVEVYVYNDDEFVFTVIGERFVKLVKGYK